jgi:hypothetical protein
MTNDIDWEAEMEALDASLPERLERAAQMAERSDIWTDTERLMPATGVADLIWEAHSEILGWRALNKLRQDSRTCPLGEDCDLTVAWMAGRESAKDEYKARIAPALEPRPDAGGALKRALEQAREEGRREEREACAKLAHDLQVSADQINDAYAAKRLPGVFLEPDGYQIAAAIRARAAELKGEKK